MITFSICFSIPRGIQKIQKWIDYTTSFLYYDVLLKIKPVNYLNYVEGDFTFSGIGNNYMKTSNIYVVG